MTRAPKLPPDREHLDPALVDEGAAEAAPSKPKRKARRGHDYEVGYARPPKARRWKPGQSGNPRGRPPKKPNLLEALHEVLGEVITVTMNGEPQAMTLQQALLLRLREEAARGDRGCVKLMSKILDAAPEPPPVEDDPELTKIMVDLKIAEDPVLASIRDDMRKKAEA